MTRATCLDNWPEAISGDYHPSCCRFPKSCSIPDPPPPILFCGDLVSQRSVRCCDSCHEDYAGGDPIIEYGHDATGRPATIVCCAVDLAIRDFVKGMCSLAGGRVVEET